MPPDIRNPTFPKFFTIGRKDKGKQLNSPDTKDFFRSCTNYTLVKILSYQQPVDLERSRHLNRQFGKIISTNIQYMRTKQECRLILETGSNLGRSLFITIHRSFDEGVHSKVSKFVCNAKGVTITGKPFDIKAIACGNLRTSFEKSMELILRDHCIKCLEINVLKRNLGECEMEWLLESLKPTATKISTIYVDNYADQFMELAEISGCKEMGNKPPDQDPFKQLMDSTLNIEDIVDLDCIFHFIKQWDIGKRVITHIACNYDNHVFKWDSILDMFKIAKMPTTLKGQIVGDTDDLIIERKLDNVELQIVFNPRGVGGNEYCRIEMMSLGPVVI